MLYLEDYIESIEQLPAEMKEKFTKLRCLDLEAQNDQDKNQEKIGELFQSASVMPASERQKRYGEIKSSFSNILKTTDEKVEVSNSMYDLIERYQRQLDNEIGKFKLELEADSPGITEELEKRARDHEHTIRSQRKIEKKRRQRAHNHGDKGVKGDHSPSPSLNQSNPMFGDTYSNSYSRTSGGRTPISSDLHQRLSAGGGAVASAIPPYLHFASNESRHGRPRKMTSRVQELLQGALSNKERRERASSSSWLPNIDSEGRSAQASNHDDESGNGEAEGERTWCICNQSSYGEMVACDNPNCAFEWFHYECVNISAPPKGRWYCPHCSATMKRRKLDSV